MKGKLRSLLRERVSTVMRLEAVSDRPGDEGDVLLRVFKKDMDNLSRTVGELSREAFRKAVEIVREALKRLEALWRERDIYLQKEERSGKVLGGHPQP